MRKTDVVRRKEDAFGQELWAVYSGKEVYEIVERDDGFFSARQSARVYFSEFRDWPLIEQKAMEFVRGRVLDVGCGAGRHALYLQQKGFDVIGIDSSPLAVKVCKLRGLKKVRVVALEHLDFKPNSFDTITLLGGNLSLLGNPEKAGRLLRIFHRITSRDAVIIGESRDPYKTDNPAHLDYHKLNINKGRLSGQARIRVRFEKAVTKWIEWMLVSREEMEQLLSGTGWYVNQFIDSGNTGYIAIIKKVA